MQIESVASCLLDFKDFQAHDATGGGVTTWPTLSAFHGC